METMTKTFKGENLMQALQKAQLEFGVDAIVVSMREQPGGPSWQVWKQPVVEVVAMRNPGSIPQTPMQSNLPQPSFAGQPALKQPAAAQPRPSSVPVVKQASFPQVASQDVPSVDTMNDLERILNKLNALQQQPAKPVEPARKEPETQYVNGKKVKPYIPTYIGEQKNQPVVESPAVKPASESVQMVIEEKKVVEEKTKPAAARTVVYPKTLERMRQSLLGHGVRASLVEEIIRTAYDRLEVHMNFEEKKVEQLIRDQLNFRLPIVKGEKGFPHQMVFIVGSNGAGKTSLTAKLAAYAKRTLGKKVTWVCADVVRTAAISEARTYTELLGIPLQLVYTAAELKAFSMNCSEDELILVDTPGVNPRSEQALAQLGSLLMEFPQRTTYLVVSALTKDADLNQALAGFRAFRLNGLVATRLDETSTLGNLYNLGIRSQVPFLHFTTGTRILNDLVHTPQQMLVDSFIDQELIS